MKEEQFLECGGMESYKTSNKNNSIQLNIKLCNFWCPIDLLVKKNHWIISFQKLFMCNFLVNHHKCSGTVLVQYSKHAWVTSESLVNGVNQHSVHFMEFVHIKVSNIREI